MLLTAAQIRAARALLGWSQHDLAKASALSMMTIRRIEGVSGPGRTVAENLEAVRKAFDEAGVLFQAEGETTTGGPGVRLKA